MLSRCFGGFLHTDTMVFIDYDSISMKEPDLSEQSVQMKERLQLSLGRDEVRANS